MTRRPSWQTDQCPRWCTRTHDEHDHPDDRYHRTDVRTVETLMAADDECAGNSEMRAIELGIWVGQYAGERRVWVTVEPVERRAPRLVMSSESAAELNSLLRAQLDLLED